MLEILMIVYQWGVVLADFIHLILITIQSYVVALFRFFIPPPMKSIRGKLVLITGAGHGIGAELALHMARQGARVVCVDVDEASNRDTVRAIETKELQQAWAYTCDVADKDHVKHVMGKIRREVGDIDILVNNAGIAHIKPLLQTSNEEVQRLINVNVLSHFYTLHEWLPVFTARGSGHIVALSSCLGLVGARNLVSYCSSKFAVRGLMEALKEELRYDSMYPNIKLTCVHPFVVETGLSKKYRIRFPSFNAPIAPSDAARLITEGVRREDYHVAIPSKDFYLFRTLGMLPLTVQHAAADFLGVACDA